jgi:hypothetical protein
VSFVPSCENNSVPIYKANLSDTTLAAKFIPLLLLCFASALAVRFVDAIDPIQSSPILRYHHAFGFVMIGMWGFGMIVGYRKWRSSRSKKQP